MLRLNELKLPLDHGPEALSEALCRRLKLQPEQLQQLPRVVKRSVDARRKSNIQLAYSLEFGLEPGLENRLLKRFAKDPHLQPAPDTTYQLVAQAPVNAQRPRPVVVGAGPCGYFCALLLAQMGLRPLLLERGKAVKERSSDTFGFWQGKQPFNPESNAQFGEGGAGTFSDGKLYSQVRDPRHLGRKVLEELVAAGANAEILVLHRPHIGTFKLATVVRGLRAQITALGGEIRFQSRVDRLELDPTDHSVRGVTLADGSLIAAQQVVMAVGHSARDSFAMLQQQGVAMERKPFSVGFRFVRENPSLPNPLYSQSKATVFCISDSLKSMVIDSSCVILKVIVLFGCCTFATTFGRTSTPSLNRLISGISILRSYFSTTSPAGRIFGSAAAASCASDRAAISATKAIVITLVLMEIYSANDSLQHSQQ
jgi:uncharacterized FAD-dependent dehydrogenase